MKNALFLVFIFFLAENATAQEASTILEKYFSAIGGRSTIEKITTVHSTHRQFSLSGKRDTILVKSVVKSPWFSSAKTYQKSQSKPDYEYFGNEKGGKYQFWFPMPMDRKLEKKPAYLSVAHHLLRALNEDRVQTVKDDTARGRICYGIQTTFRKTGPNDPNHIYLFDKESGLLVASSQVSLDGDITYYEDYRSVDGFLFAFRQDYYLHNTPISNTVYDEIALNQEVDMAIFYPVEKETQRSPSSKFNRIEYLDPKQGNKPLEEFMAPFRGKTILVDLWATWCAPCKMEFTHYDSSFYQFLSEQKIEMVFVSYDKYEKTKAWKKDVAAFNVNGYHVIAGPKLRQSINDEIYQRETNYIPRYFLIDSQGNILSRQVPKPSSPEFYDTIKQLLQKG